ncbi:cytochrome c551 [Falsibacillus albus]|uniref:Cytochrome c n=1 Tax=Falsibacillus albus TaxID=2478915 RepID=A0A3L7K124_9BACI|nr:cytochrome c [Falsibacillus albus]RLQ96768.1 cytochrome c [Falsibacillus albus]
MKKLLSIVLGAALIMGLAACGSGNDNSQNGGGDSTETASSGDPAAKIFKQKCSTCHGNNLEGGFGPNLQKVGSRYTEDQILLIIQNGKGQMPKGVIKGDDAKMVAKWLSKKK